MATTQVIDATIFASSHPDIAKRTSISGILTSSVMLLGLTDKIMWASQQLVSLP